VLSAPVLCVDMCTVREVIRDFTRETVTHQWCKRFAIIEAYIDVSSLLCVAGLATSIVFASSNTKEYHAPNTTHLPLEIEADLGAMGMECAPHILRL